MFRATKEVLNVVYFSWLGYMSPVPVFKKPGSYTKEEIVVRRIGTRELRIRLYYGKKKRDAVIVAIHGSGFTGRFEGDPPVLGFVDDVTIALVEHRGSSDGGTFPDALHDVVEAVRYLEDNGFKKFGVYGDSSGGWFASMLGVLSARDNDISTTPPPISCVVALFPPVKFDVMDEQSDPKFQVAMHAPKGSFESKFMGFSVAEKPVDHASPLTYVTPDTPPFFVVAGTKDPCVPCAQSKMLFDTLEKAAPGKHHYTEIPGAGHGGPKFAQPDLVSSIFDFYKLHLDL
ncbi:hypothetical protein CTAYLR_003778 [Chrysophaeum taylorii]|uniref:BD-FAE-like domain-containing protein n=1 Tax=Chrysophaeum taylorii TaxID=2483200 RepID=A0AAD7XKE7_9STRA|nr:hypothetical protein CTAYLR_003778 [Chrysophaeum taylorii]